MRKNGIRKSLYKLSTIAIACCWTIAAMSGCSTTTEEERLGAARIIPSASIITTINTHEGIVEKGIVTPLPAESDISLRITSGDGSYSHTWTPLSSYPVSEPLRIGEYKVEAANGLKIEEGFDKPFFYGNRTIYLHSGETTNVEIECRPANALFRVEASEKFRTRFPGAKAIFHANGGRFLEVAEEETRILYTLPGDTEIYLDITTSEDNHAKFSALRLPATSAASLYEVGIDYRIDAAGIETVVLTVDYPSGTQEAIVPLTEEFLASEAPTITTSGFNDLETVEVVEGNIPPRPLLFELGGSRPSSVVLSSVAPGLVAEGWPAEINLSSADDAMMRRLEAFGLKITRENAQLKTVDLTDIVAHLRSTDRDVQFALTASSDMGKISGPVTLSIAVEPVDLSVIEISKILMGVNTGKIKMLAKGDNPGPNLSVEARKGSGDNWESCEILSTLGSGNEWDVTYRLPFTPQKNPEIRVLYCGEERASSTVNVVSPSYTIEADAFATIARLRITASDPTMLNLITELLHIYVNGRITVLTHRTSEPGIIIVGGLEEKNLYVITTTLFDESVAHEHLSPPIEIVTERKFQIPNGDFEDVKDNELNYTNLPSGGRYSQNIVDIFNQQNFVSYDYFIPKTWANTNRKTFCTAAKNHNTWYMQPSVYTVEDAAEGSYAVAIVSTAWDIDGPAIDDYRQTAPPYVKYSRNIPRIAHRAAGKIFLGAYGFNPATGEEAYVEGIEFGSRPTALNGFYRFVPCATDIAGRGLAIVELIGNVAGTDIVISRGEYRFPPAIGYTAFSIPLSYDKFGIKATKLKLMFSSSTETGSIEHESQNIITYSDPITSTSLGGTLWLDGLTFSY